jgi:hypothetical protein
MVSRTGGVIVAQETLKPSFLPFRNPLLIDTNQMDLLPYVPQLIPAYAAILSEIYGIDFLDPPAASRRRGQVAGSVSRDLWAARSVQDWVMIGRKWNVRFILTKPDLRLPLNGITMDNLAIWEIPPRAP